MSILFNKKTLIITIIIVLLTTTLLPTISFGATGGNISIYNKLLRLMKVVFLKAIQIVNQKMGSTQNTHVSFDAHIFKLYKQDADEYVNVPFPARGNDATVGKNGCGITCCAIVSSGYGYKDTPATQTLTNYKDENYYDYGYYTNIQKYFEDKDFTVEYRMEMTNTEVIEKLKDEYKIILRSKYGKVGNYELGNYIHWYTILDVKTEEGTTSVFVGDPLEKGGGWFDLIDLTERDNYILVKKET